MKPDDQIASKEQTEKLTAEFRAKMQTVSIVRDGRIAQAVYIINDVMAPYIANSVSEFTLLNYGIDYSRSNYIFLLSLEIPQEIVSNEVYTDLVTEVKRISRQTMLPVLFLSTGLIDTNMFDLDDDFKAINLLQRDRMPGMPTLYISVPSSLPSNS